MAAAVAAFAAERSAALAAVITVSHLCRRVQQVMVTADSINKKDKSPVTVADYAAQGIIIHEVGRSHCFCFCLISGFLSYSVP
jgi:3'-phosphoadenosine 5'-phosphosulfate (PAPS) 3'-phosphatase